MVSTKMRMSSVVLSTENHAETDDVTLDVDGDEEVGDHMDLTEGLNVVVVEDDMTALDKVLVGLQVVEAPHDKPHYRDQGVHLLHHDRAPLCKDTTWVWWQATVLRVILEGNIYLFHNETMNLLNETMNEWFGVF